MRQFAGSQPVWGNVEFVFSGDFGDCDIVFVYDAIPEDLSGRLTAQRSMFIASEPASVKTYHQDFLAQFDSVLTTDRSTRHPNVVYGQLGLPWLLGTYDIDGTLLKQPMNFDDFEDFDPPKTKLISVVSSNKAFTEGHRSRLEFVERLKLKFGDEIDVFGRNINGFGDKTEVLSSYKYHISIENSSYDDYWTEKLSDSFLTLTYPIYFGCPNITKYFPGSSLTQIDIGDTDAALEIIQRVIESDEAQAAKPAMQEARQLVLRDHNLFSILARHATESVATGEHAHKLRPETEFTRKRPRWKRLLKKLVP